MPIATILVCDDDPSLRLLVRLALAPRGYRVSGARDGDECLSMAERLRPQLIILDAQLRDRHGIEVARALRQNRDIDRSQILMVTGDLKPGDRQAAAQAGVAGLLEKPFGIDRLLREIDRLLARAEPRVKKLSLRRLE